MPLHRVLAGKGPDGLPTIVGTAIIYHNDLVIIALAGTNTSYPLYQFRQRFFLIKKGMTNDKSMKVLKYGL
jgi:hypothetical protein